MCSEFASGARKAEPQPLRNAVDALRNQFDLTRALARFRKRTRQARHQLAQPMLDRLGRRDRFGEALLHTDPLGRHDRVQRLGCTAGRLVKACHDHRAETAHERRARKAEELADRVHAEPGEQFESGGVKSQRSHGKRSDGGGVRTWGDDQRRTVTEPRQCPGRARTVRHRHARGNAAADEQTDEAAGEARFAAMQMRDAGQVDEQTIRVRDRHCRSPATRQQLGECAKVGGVPFRIGCSHLQSRHLRAGHGESHAGREAERARGRVGRGDLNTRADLVRRHQRRFGRREMSRPGERLFAADPRHHAAERAAGLEESTMTISGRGRFAHAVIVGVRPFAGELDRGHKGELRQAGRSDVAGLSLMPVAGATLVAVLARAYLVGRQAERIVDHLASARQLLEGRPLMRRERLDRSLPPRRRWPSRRHAHGA